MSKTPTSFKLSPTAHEILAELSSRRGQSKVAIIERLLREEAEREGDNEELREIEKAFESSRTVEGFARRLRQIRKGKQ